jgi:hypothetical protein
MGANAVTTVYDFTAGQVLTAAQMDNVNCGIPVFATTTTRDAAFGGTGEKTLAEGQMAYIENIAGSSAVQYYDGAAWQTLVVSGVTQVKSTAKTDTFTMSSSTFADITGLSVSITPTSASNKILVLATLSVGNNPGVTSIAVQLMRDTTAIGIGDTAGSRGRVSGSTKAVDTSIQTSLAVNFLDSPATTSATTYKVQIRSVAAAQTVVVNRSSDDTDSGNYTRSISTITVMEVAP